MVLPNAMRHEVLGDPLETLNLTTESHRTHHRDSRHHVPGKLQPPFFFKCRLRTRISCHCGIFGLIFSGIWEVGDIWKSYPR